MKRIITLVSFLTLLSCSSHYAMKNTIDEMDPFDLLKDTEYTTISLHGPVDQEEIEVDRCACPSLTGMYKKLAQHLYPCKENLKITAQSIFAGSLVFGGLEACFALFGETKNKSNMAADPTFIFLNGLIGLTVSLISIGIMKEYGCSH